MNTIHGMKEKFTSFTAVDISEEETLQGLVLNVYQKAVIQNNISDVAEQLIAQVIDVSTPEKLTITVQQDAYLKAQLTVYQNLLDRSIEAEQQLAENARKNSGL